MKQWPSSQISDSHLMATTIISSSLRSDNSSVGITQINKNYDSRFRAYTEFTQRLSRWAPVLMLVLGVAFGVFTVRSRRLEYAGALHAGQSKPAQILEIMCETCIWIIIAQVVSTCVLGVYALRFISEGSIETLTAGLRSVSTFGCGIVIGTVVAGLCIRQSQLFTYFKTR
ncbi:hypothetical protein ACFQY8_06340 [Alloscardovia venturai]|uniref:ABC transporter permease n=1 Tax=Alloscardovia venturai TaxID=1769421 RepID=A0ABW2Y523_9BIFI